MDAPCTVRMAALHSFFFGLAGLNLLLACLSCCRLVALQVASESQDCTGSHYRKSQIMLKQDTMLILLAYAG